jgi:hypothetical protein
MRVSPIGTPCQAPMQWGAYEAPLQPGDPQSQTFTLGIRGKFHPPKHPDLTPRQFLAWLAFVLDTEGRDGAAIH